jgi:predicted alpha/beta-fold hydrolase
MTYTQFSPPTHLKNAHIQSIMNSVGPRKFRAKKITKTLKSEQLIISTEAGVRLTAELDNANTSHPATNTKALVILIHGWEGSSQSAYQVTTAFHLINSGFDVLRLNLRDHGDSHHLNPELFNSTLLAEVGDAIKSFTSDRSYSNTFLAGFSLGGNFTLRIVADRAKELGIVAAVAICPPIDPNNAMTVMNNGLFIYEKYFFRRWTRSLQKKLKYFPELDFSAEMNQIKTLEDVNQTFVPKFTPFQNPKDYFSSYALTGDRLKTLEIPAHMIVANDDPILPAEDVDKINASEHLIVEKQDHGGHCGFIKDLKGRSWVEERLVEIFNGYLEVSALN